MWKLRPCHTPFFIELMLWTTESQFCNSGLAGKPSAHCLLEAGKNQSPLSEVGIEKSLFQNLLGSVHSAVNSIFTYPKRIYCTLLCARSHDSSAVIKITAQFSSLPCTRIRGNWSKAQPPGLSSRTPESILRAGACNLCFNQPPFMNLKHIKI